MQKKKNTQLNGNRNSKSDCNNNESQNNSHKIGENTRKKITYILSSANTLKHRFDGRCSTEEKKMETKPHFCVPFSDLFDFDGMHLFAKSKQYNEKCMLSSSRFNGDATFIYVFFFLVLFRSIAFFFASETYCRHRAVSRGQVF